MNVHCHASLPPITGEYLIDNNRGRTNGELNLSSGMLDGKVTGLLTRNDGTNAVSMTAEYSYNHGPQRRVSFNTKLRDKSTDNKKEFDFGAYVHYRCFSSPQEYSEVL